VRAVHLVAVAAGAVILACVPFYLEKGERLAARELTGDLAEGDAALSPPGAERPALLLLDWRCDRGNGLISVEGRVRNIGSRTLTNVVAIGVFQAASKDFVKSDRALLRYSTLLPGQQSAFSTATEDDPAIATCAVDFGHLLGGSIAFSEAVQEEASAAPGPDKIRALQIHLRASGYDPGPADGVLGPQTLIAIRAFQRDHGLTPDGRISADLLALVPTPGG
jgi:hypothetical protein